MISTLENIFFIVITICIFIRTLAFALYEIKEENNTFGGIFSIIFCLTSLLLSNVIILSQ
jgi:hypothetical protein